MTERPLTFEPARVPQLWADSLQGTPTAEELAELAWWYWLITDLLLAAALWGWGLGFLPAVVLTLLQTLHFRAREGGWTAFPVQVRLGYLLWLLLGLWRPLGWFHGIQLAGTTAMVLVDYCPMARKVSLLPWNRRLPLTRGSSGAPS